MYGWISGVEWHTAYEKRLNFEGNFPDFVGFYYKS